VTPTSLVAAALLGSKRRILSRAQLEWSVKKIAQHIQVPKPKLEPVLENLLQDSLVVAENAGKRVYYRVPEKSTLSLDYYKNNLIHHFAADAILATAFQISTQSDRKKIVKKSILQRQAQILSQIFKFEFSYENGASFEEIFNSRLDHAIDARIMLRVQDQIRLTDLKDSGEQLLFVANLLSNFVDAYWVCARKLESALIKTPAKKVLISVLLDCLKEAVLSGASDYPEIVSKSLVENAVLYFENAGFLSWENGRAKFKPDKKEDLKKTIKILQECHYGR
jgi:glycerol-3-phosphate O-acyltransferase